MRSTKLSANALVCITVLCASYTVCAQTHRQQNNPLDQLKPTDEKAEFVLPAERPQPGSADADMPFSVNSIIVKKVVPNSQGNGIASVELFQDPMFSQRIESFLRETNNKPTYSAVLSLSAQLSQVLREKGSILSTVFVPAQKISDGTLELHLLQGILGGTQVVDDSLRNQDVIQGLFAPLLNKVVRRDEVESQLMRVQHLLPGVTAQGSFSRGERLGQSIATITVAEFTPFHSSIYLDNYGNQSTGEFRLGARFVLNNPTGFEDRLTVDLVANETPDGFDDPQNPIEKDDFQCCFGGFQYEIFSDSLLYSYGFAWSRTQYDIGNNADFQLARLGFSGESNTTRLFFNYHQTLTPTYSQTWSLNWTFSEADLMARNDFIGADVLLNRDQVPEYDLGYSFTKHHETNVYYGQIGAFFGTDPDSSFPIPTDVFGYDDSPINVFGQAVGPSRVGSNDNSFRVKADLFAQLNSVSEAVQFKARMAMQKSSDILSPIQQFSLAGPYAVRAYPSGSFLADSGLLLSLDATYALSHSADLTVFYDVAYGELNDIDPAAEFDATIQGLGLGLQYRHSNDWEVKLTAATALGISDGVNGEPRPNIRNGGEEVTGRKDTQVFASFLYNF